MRNPYFPQGTTSEQGLYEDLIIESIQIYGQDVYYLPREIVDLDTLFNEDVQSKFGSHYQIEMYIPNNQDWEGDGELFAKFGIEIRDEVSFVVPRRRWSEEQIQTNAVDRPAEGDIVYLPLSKSFFEVSKVKEDSRFYQLKDLPIYELQCTLFEFSNNEFDTGSDEIDDFIDSISKQMFLEVSDPTSIALHGDIEQGDVGGTVMSIDGNIVQVGQLTGGYFIPGSAIHTDLDNIETQIEILQADEKMVKADQRDVFDEKRDKFVDFSEDDPFGGW